MAPRRPAVDARAKALRPLVRRRSVRRAEGRFVIESAKTLSVALDAGLHIERVVVESGRAGPADERVVDRASELGIEIVDVADGALESLVSAQHPQPVAAIAVTPSFDLSESLRGASLVLVAVEVSDPGNLGTIIRSAEAAGADAVIVAGDAVDPWSPKVVRSSAGGAFLVPVVETDIGDALDAVAGAGVLRLAADAHDGVDHDLADLTRPVAFVLGNEAHGLPEAAASRVDEWIRIPNAGRNESLNVAMVASILGFEAARQRRIAGIVS
ncbi:MAG: RNA methyltransferase [Acidimicrobiia bacterium]|nr:RNA methyltransferase [Acidimicrobiia bacterium]